MKQHVENAKSLIAYTFNEIEVYKLLYQHIRPGKPDRFLAMGKSCQEFLELLETKAYKSNIENQDIPRETWTEIEYQQNSTRSLILYLTPPFLHKKIVLRDMEPINHDDSEELKIAKYYSNCQRLSNIVLQLLIWAENPIGQEIRHPYQIKHLQVATDTVTENEPFTARSNSALLKNFKEYGSIKKVHDLQIMEINDDGHFKLKIMGKSPRLTLRYFNVGTLKETEHEIRF